MTCGFKFIKTIFVSYRGQLTMMVSHERCFKEKSDVPSLKLCIKFPSVYKYTPECCYSVEFSILEGFQSSPVQ